MSLLLDPAQPPVVPRLPALVPDARRAPEHVRRVHGPLHGEQPPVVAAPEGLLPVLLVRVRLVEVRPGAGRQLPEGLEPGLDETPGLLFRRGVVGGERLGKDY